MDFLSILPVPRQLRRCAERLPAKHQLYLHFSDATYLTVTVQGWGSGFLLEREQVPYHQFVNLRAPSPLSDTCTADYFHGLFAALEPNDTHRDGCAAWEAGEHSGDRR